MWTMTKKGLRLDRLEKTIRFTQAEVDRLNPVLERIEGRDKAAFVSLNQVFKEFIGLTNTGLITAQDRQDILDNTQARPSGLVAAVGGKASGDKEKSVAPMAAKRNNK